MSEASKRRYQELGPKYTSGGLVCFRCLQKSHISSNCPKYSGPLPDRLCIQNNNGRRKVCGYHYPCKEKQFQNLKLEENPSTQKPGNPSIWGKNS